MTCISNNTPGRDQERCAKKSPISRLSKRILDVWRARKHPHIKDLSPRLARDAGLSEGEVADHQHRWPSETMHHPRR